MGTAPSAEILPLPSTQSDWPLVPHWLGFGRPRLSFQPHRSNRCSPSTALAGSGAPFHTFLFTTTP